MHREGIMKIILILVSLTLSYCPALVFSKDFSGAAETLADSAASRRLHRFAIETFESEDAAGSAAAAAARAAISEAMYGLYGIGVADAEVLTALKSRGRFWAQVSIKGKIFKRGTGRTLVLAAVETGSSTPLAVVQMELDDNGRLPRADFRDAPAGDWCALEASVLKAENRRLVDAHARRWALQVRMPGFTLNELDGPPSRGVTDYATMQAFYLAANRYYEQAGPVEVSAAELEAIKVLLERELAFSKRCRGRP